MVIAVPVVHTAGPAARRKASRLVAIAIVGVLQPRRETKKHHCRSVPRAKSRTAANHPLTNKKHH